MQENWLQGNKKTNIGPFQQFYPEMFWHEIIGMTHYDEKLLDE